ncbi:signal recognition particle-docking protein FtsY [Eubacterium uniforme]|uniref:Signal recognition particle receptor FtsY n=1 Tax=Eubacterium uniforme TaxID=39495 RepID=A0A1T4V650_9FIRM|nr:signal recognition particle-docking protein FtsY [Eubacterium uniforme]
MFKFFKKDKTEEVVNEESVEVTNDSVKTSETIDNDDSVEVESNLSEEVSDNEDSKKTAFAEESEEISLTNAEDSVSDDNNDTTKENKGFFKRLVAGLSKTRNSIVNSIDSVFSAFSSIDEDLYEELEEILITSDIGVKTTMEILDNLRDEVKEKHIKEPSELRELLIQNLTNAMNIGENEYDFENKKSIILVIGVNGVGKTTTIGKLAGQYKSQGKKVVLAAADTFRAAASEQLVTWANRAGVDIVASNEGADPGSVIFDAIASGKSKDADLIICDTAGRLHNKKNLMEELKKLDRIISKEYGDAHRENFIVLDATTGQNALEQAKQFKEVAEITGVILTKMDGTAKGGIAIAIQSELGIPVKFIGVGESIEDLQKFDSEKFIQALFTKDE